MLPSQLELSLEKNKDIEALQAQLDIWIKSYLDEIDNTLTYNELINFYDILPLYDKEKNVNIGIFGFNLATSEKLGVIGTVSVTYVDRNYRTNFKRVLQIITEFMKGMGCNKIEFCLNPKIHRFFEGMLDQEPSSYNYICDPDEFLVKLER